MLNKSMIYRLKEISLYDREKKIFYQRFRHQYGNLSNKGQS